MGAYEYPEAVYYPLLLLSLVRRIFELEVFIQLFSSTVNEIVELNDEVWRKRVVWPDEEFQKPPQSAPSLFA